MTDLEENVNRCEGRLGELSRPLRLALEYVYTDAASSLTKSRLVMERLLIDVYQREMGSEPKKPLLGEMLTNNQFARKVERRILSRIHSIRDMGNFGPHGEPVEASDAARVLDDLCAVIDWYQRKYQAEADPAPMPPAAPERRPEKRGGMIASLKVGKFGCLLQFTLACVLLLVSLSIISGFAIHEAAATKSIEGSSPPRDLEYPVYRAPPPAFRPDPEWTPDPDGPPTFEPDPDWPPAPRPHPRSPFPPDSPRYVPAPDESPEPGASSAPGRP